MNADANLLDRIYRLTRGDLDGREFPRPTLSLLLRGYSFVRIKRITEFWKAQQSVRIAALTESFANVLTGLHGQRCPWVFVLRGSASAIECWFGASINILDRQSLRSVIRSALPDVQFDSSATFDTTTLDNWQHTVICTGIPALSSCRQGDPISSLCRGLTGVQWIYIVRAEPIEPIETIRTINFRASEIRDVYANHMLKQAAIDDHDRIAQRLIQLLETDQGRYEHGRQLGMWSVNILLAAEQSASLERGRGLLYGVFSSNETNPIPIRVHTCNNSSSEQPKIDPLHSAEVAVLAHPPSEDFSGYEIVEHTRFGLETPELLIRQKPVVVGDIVDRGTRTGNRFAVSDYQLTKHALITGVTGSGKTNTCFNLLEQIWDSGRGVPFLVIESAKSEYRQLLTDDRFKGLRIFTIGDETVSPIRLNPFEVSSGTLVQTHIDYLKSLFSAAFVLYPPMPYVLEQSIQEVYEDRGWDIVHNINRRGNKSWRQYPTLGDLAAKIPVVIDRMGYDRQLTMDVTAGLLARINQLRIGGGKGSMLDQRRSFPATVLFEGPCVLELKQIVSDDEKAFLIGLLLIRLYEYRESKPPAGKPELCHVLLIEEAHRLLRNTSTDQSSEISANPRGRAIEVFSNILSEIRAFGQGIVIAEQVPTKLTPDAIKNSNLKVLHRLVAEDDRQVVGGSVNLDDAQKRRLATLSVGEAVVYVEGLRKPVLVSVSLSRRKDLDAWVTDGEIRGYMESFRANHAEFFLRYPECTGCAGGQTGVLKCTERRPDADDLILGAFRRLINVMRLSKPRVLHAYTEFDRNIRRTARGDDGKILTYCIFVHLVEAEIERRGEFSCWDFSHVSALIEHGCNAIRALSEGLGQATKKSLESIVTKELIPFVNLFRQIYKVERLPYAGCQVCLAPCHYRFDMSFPVSSLEVRDFQTAFLDGDIADMVMICRTAAESRFLESDTRSVHGAAVCFAVQQLCELGLTRSHQDTWVQQLAETIEAGNRAATT